MRLAQRRGVGPTPPEVLQNAQAAFSVLQKESRLLELAYDSLIDSDITVETFDGPVRLLEFRGGDSTVELALAPVGERCDLVGRMHPPGVRSVRVHTPSVVVAAVIDPDGAFVASGVPHGPMSVRLFIGGAVGRIHTDWLTV